MPPEEYARQEAAITVQARARGRQARSGAGNGTDGRGGGGGATSDSGAVTERQQQRVAADEAEEAPFRDTMRVSFGGGDDEPLAAAVALVQPPSPPPPDPPPDPPDPSDQPPPAEPTVRRQQRAATTVQAHARGRKARSGGSCSVGQAAAEEVTPESPVEEAAVAAPMLELHAWAEAGERARRAAEAAAQLLECSCAAAAESMVDGVLAEVAEVEGAEGRSRVALSAAESSVRMAALSRRLEAGFAAMQDPDDDVKAAWAKLDPAMAVRLSEALATQAALLDAQADAHYRRMLSEAPRPGTPPLHSEGVGSPRTSGPPTATATAAVAERPTAAWLNGAAGLLRAAGVATEHVEEAEEDEEEEEGQQEEARSPMGLEREAKPDRSGERGGGDDALAATAVAVVAPPIRAPLASPPREWRFRKTYHRLLSLEAGSGGVSGGGRRVVHFFVGRHERLVLSGVGGVGRLELRATDEMGSEVIEPSIVYDSDVAAAAASATTSTGSAAFSPPSQLPSELASLRTEVWSGVGEFEYEFALVAPLSVAAAVEQGGGVAVTPALKLSFALECSAGEGEMVSEPPTPRETATSKAASSVAASPHSPRSPRSSPRRRSGGVGVGVGVGSGGAVASSPSPRRPSPESSSGPSALPSPRLDQRAAAVLSASSPAAAAATAAYPAAPSPPLVSPRPLAPIGGELPPHTYPDAYGGWACAAADLTAASAAWPSYQQWGWGWDAAATAAAWQYWQAQQQGAAATGALQPQPQPWPPATYLQPWPPPVHYHEPGAPPPQLPRPNGDAKRRSPRAGKGVVAKSQLPRSPPKGPVGFWAGQPRGAGACSGAAT